MRNILLAGGTSETEAIAQALAEEGHSVLVCTATDFPLRTGEHPAIRRRCGRMSAEQFAALMREEQIDLVVNAAHPFAVGVRDTTRAAAGCLNVAHVEFLRPDSSDGADGVLHAADHREAAQMAVEAGQKILLTIGVNNLAPYVEASRASGRELVVRVLAREESVSACRAAGLRDEQVITAHGAASVEENVAAIRKHGINVLVTKESGEAGGVPAKYEAARLTGCIVVSVQRPAYGAANCARTVPELMEKVRGVIGSKETMGVC